MKKMTSSEVLTSVNEAILHHEHKIKQASIMIKGSCDTAFWEKERRIAIISISALKIFKTFAECESSEDRKTGK